MKILCFAPHSAIWVHAFPEALIVEALKQSGHEIIYVTCGGVFDRLCVPMSAHGVGFNASPEKKRAVCATCNGYARIIRSEFHFGGYELPQLLSAQDKAWAKRVAEGVTRENFINLVEGGVGLGRIALSHFLINQKKYNLEFSDAEWQRYLVELENTLLSYAACRTLFDREQPDRVLLYTSAYSVNFVCCEIARLRSIPHYYVAAAGNLSDRLQRLVLARGHAVDFQKNNLAYWPKYRNFPINEGDIGYTVNHILELLRGRSPFVYSSPSVSARADLKSLFGISSGQKVLLATTSSQDEIFASQVCGLWPADSRMAFPSLIEWIRALIAYVAQRPDLFLIIRVHPREFPGKRDAVKSDHARFLEKELSALPDNAKTNWPADQISLYDLACITDVCLNAWSSAGKELALFGIPVVTYTPDLLFYPTDINYVATDPVDYFKSIEKALRDGWSVENVRRAFRWYTLEYQKSMLDLSESHTFNETARPSILARGVHRLRRAIAPNYRQVNDCRYRAVSLRQRSLINELVTSGKTSLLDLIEPSGDPEATFERETEGLRMAFRRIVGVLSAQGDVTAKYDGLLGRMSAFADSGLESPQESRIAT